MLLINASFQKITSALATFPSSSIWLETLGWLIVLGILARTAPLSDALSRVKKHEPTTRLIAALIAFFTPALAEELVFRVLLLPSPGAQLNLSWISQFFVALLAYTLWHPIQAKLFRPSYQPVFTHRQFLALVVALGVLCSALYLRSGSIWPAVIVHWFGVLALFIFVDQVPAEGSA